MRTRDEILKEFDKKFGIDNSDTQNGYLIDGKNVRTFIELVIKEALSSVVPDKMEIDFYYGEFYRGAEWNACRANMIKNIFKIIYGNGGKSKITIYEKPIQANDMGATGKM